MGLDTTEMLLDVEECFGIEIFEEEAQSISTVGDLYELVVSKVELDKIPFCVSLDLFFNLRNVMADKWSVPKKSLKLSSNVNDILGENERYKKWESVKKILPFYLPNLKLSMFNPLRLILICYPLLAIFLGYSFLELNEDSATLFYVFAFMLWLILWRAFLPFSSVIPARFVTVRDILESDPAINILSKDIDNKRENVVWSRLCSIVAEAGGLDLRKHKIEKESRLNKDLGLD